MPALRLAIGQGYARGVVARAVVASLVAFALPASADAYVRLATERPGEGAVIAGSEVLLGRSAPTGATLAAHPLGGGPARPLALPGAGAEILGLAASERTVAVLTATNEPEEG